MCLQTFADITIIIMDVLLEGKHMSGFTELYSARTVGGIAVGVTVS